MALPTTDSATCFTAQLPLLEAIAKVQRALREFSPLNAALIIAANAGREDFASNRIVIDSALVLVKDLLDNSKDSSAHLAANAMFQASEIDSLLHDELHARFQPTTQRGRLRLHDIIQTSWNFKNLPKIFLAVAWDGGPEPQIMHDPQSIEITRRALLISAVLSPQTVYESAQTMFNQVSRASPMADMLREWHDKYARDTASQTPSPVGEEERSYLNLFNDSIPGMHPTPKLTA